MKKILFTFLFTLLFVSFSQAATNPWEKKGESYFLTKDTKDYFSAPGAGNNDFASKYLNYDGVDFLVKGPDSWKDYGRLSLGGNNIFTMPIKSGAKVDEVHFLAGGNFGNLYKHDGLLKLYGENYYYGTISVLFVYQNDTYQMVSVPVFWDWFHLGTGEWKRGGAKVKGLGENPVRKNCSMFHITFTNPKPSEPLKNILVSDSWVEDFPFSDIFAVTLKSQDAL